MPTRIEKVHFDTSDQRIRRRLKGVPRAAVDFVRKLKISYFGVCK